MVVGGGKSDVVGAVEGSGGLMRWGGSEGADLQ